MEHCASISWLMYNDQNWLLSCCFESTMDTSKNTEPQLSEIPQIEIDDAHGEIFRRYTVWDPGHLREVVGVLC